MPRFLIVEDNEVNREFLLLLLEQRGECAWAESGEAALDMFTCALDEERGFDCVIMDIMLPGMDGLQTLEKIRALEHERGLGPDQQIKTIVASALDDQSKMNRAFFQGQAITYLTKPFSINEMREELDNFGL